MHLETVVSLTDWLKDPTHGVNAQLPRVPRLAGDGEPDPVGWIGDGFRDRRVAELDTPPQPTALYVLADGPLELEGELQGEVRRSPAVAVAIRYVWKGADRAHGARMSAYVLRALEYSLGAWMEADPAARTVNQVHVESCNAIRQGPWAEACGDAKAIAVLAAEFTVRDCAPRG